MIYWEPICPRPFEIFVLEGRSEKKAKWMKLPDCERYCSHGEDKLHAEARAIRAATTYAEPEPGR